MRKPKSIWANETRKILLDFKTYTDYLIPARRLDLVIINNNKKRDWNLVGFVVLPGLKVKVKESEKKNRYWDLARKLKKTVDVDVEGVGNTNCS